MKVIGIGGRMGSGKDPAAQVVQAFTDGPTRILSLAQPLKDMVAMRCSIDPYGPELNTFAGKEKLSPNPVRPGNTYREDLIDLGDAFRLIDPDTLMLQLLRKAEALELEYVIVPDVRYPNELDWCHDAFWIGVDTPGMHGTEAALSSDDFDEHRRFMQDTVPERLDALRFDLIRGLFRERN